MHIFPFEYEDTVNRTMYFCDKRNTGFIAAAFLCYIPTLGEGRVYFYGQSTLFNPI